MMEFHDRSHDEAAEWFARRRRGVMTLQERADYEAWSRDPANSAAMTDMDHIWEIAARFRAPAHSQMENSDSRPVNLTRSAVLAILCIVTLGAGMISYNVHSDFWTRLDWVER